jgi:isoamylase
MTQPRILQLVMDSLRYWVTEMHVDGFRFDLAAALAREEHAVDRLSAFFDIIQQDPVLSRVKMIAEPWDLGEGGYQLGNFPHGWSEWNGRFRDQVRSFWRSDEGLAAGISSRITGSSDLYQQSGRGPLASINFITSHDGFTLADLVSYNCKHNEANREGNSDGDTNNISWNCGWEGHCESPTVQNMRKRQRWNMLATLIFAHGVPMLAAGDEFGRSQRGNNNAYCQDNELSWIDWRMGEEEEEQLAFVRTLIELRKRHLVFRRQFFTHCLFRPRGNPILWYRPTGGQMRSEDWHRSYTRCLGLLLSGRGLQEYDERGKRLEDDSFLLLFNAHWGDVAFNLPNGPESTIWTEVFNTATVGKVQKHASFHAEQSVLLAGRSMLLLQQPRALARAAEEAQRFSDNLIVLRPVPA